MTTEPGKMMGLCPTYCLRYLKYSIRLPLLPMRYYISLYVIHPNSLYRDYLYYNFLLLIRWLLLFMMRYESFSSSFITLFSNSVFFFSIFFFLLSFSLFIPFVLF